MAKEQVAFMGARQVLQRCLGLKAGQHLVIFLDETTVEAGSVLVESADQLAINYTAIFLPVSVQRRIPKVKDLNMPTQAVANEARAIISCTNARPDCISFRQRILETSWSAHTRIGHMPGANLDVLGLASVDFDRLISDCLRVEHAMARGEQLEFISYTPDNVPHLLTADIGGWKRLPVASDGVIQDGAWGNTPSGETFIAPLENSAHGSVVVSGSLPDRVIEPGEEIVLYFETGRLVSVEPAGGQTARWLNESQINKAIAQGDQNWSNLAEIGIGLNPGVKDLTGNMLFDEKMAGTAHIALGRNTFMGGTVTATIHCDMVVRQPTIRIDGKKILERGEMQMSDLEWYENYTRIDLSESPLEMATEVSRSGAQTEYRNSLLHRMLISDTGRVSACPVGDENTALLSGAVYKVLPVDGDWIPVSTLATRARLQVDAARCVLHVMWLYNLINIR